MSARSDFDPKTTPDGTTGGEDVASRSYAERITGVRDPKDPDGLITLDQLTPDDDLADDSVPPLSRLNPPGNRMPDPEA